MKKDIIYHRAGISFKNKEGLLLFAEDFKHIMQSLGLNDNKITFMALHYQINKDQETVDFPHFTVLPYNNFGNIERAIEVSLRDNDTVYDFTNEQQTNNFFILPNNGDYKLFVCSAQLSEKLLFRICITFTSDNFIYITSYVCTNVNGFVDDRNSPVARFFHNYHIVWGYPEDHISQAGGYILDFLQTDNQHYFKWNIGFSNNGGLLSSFNLTSIDEGNDLYIACEDTCCLFFTTIKSLDDNKEYPAIINITNKERTIENNNGSTFIDVFEGGQWTEENEQKCPKIYVYSDLCIFLGETNAWRFFDTLGESYFYLSNEDQIPLEREQISNYYISPCIKQQYGHFPILVNLISKQYRYYCPNLYRKQTSTETFFGTIKVNNEIYLVGSFFCLKC